MHGVACVRRDCGHGERVPFPKSTFFYPYHQPCDVAALRIITHSSDLLVSVYNGPMNTHLALHFTEPSEVARCLILIRHKEGPYPWWEIGNRRDGKWYTDTMNDGWQEYYTVICWAELPDPRTTVFRGEPIECPMSDP